MYFLIALVIGSIMIGFGTSSWLIGGGVLIIGFGWHQTFIQTVNDMYAGVIRNLLTIYKKLPKDKS